MKSFRQQLLESFPLDERVEVDRVSRKLCLDDNDPLLWLLFHMRSSGGFHAKGLQTRNRFKALPQSLLPALVSTIVASLTTTLLLLWIFPHSIDDSRFRLIALESSIAKIQTETETARNKLGVLNKDAEILTQNQNAVYQNQIQVFDLIRDEQKHYELLLDGDAKNTHSSR